MRNVWVDVVAGRDGAQVWRGALPHGAAPEDALASVGWRSASLPQVTREPGGILVLTYEVSPLDGASQCAVAIDAASPRVDGSSASVDRSLTQTATRERAEPVQRVAAYVVVWSTRGLLATQFSGLTRAAGAWGLPGGGVEPDEDPVEAAVRECWEETGQVVTIGALLGVTSRHWVGRAPSGRLEDFHALGLLYAGSCRDPRHPLVHDVGGTTSSAAWVPEPDVRNWPWASAHAWVATSSPS